MPYHPQSVEAREFQALGIGLILYSLLFLPLLGYGWFHIVGSMLPTALAWAGAVVIAMLAWTLARIVGGSAEGIAGNRALFGALLILSAVGVFNTLMIRLEGKAIFIEAIDRAAARYEALPRLARSAAADPEAIALRRRVDALRTQLAQEIANPRNCGEGPEAGRILAQLKAELPGLVRYSGSAGDCGLNAQLIRMYGEQIDTLLYGTDVFVRGNVQQRETVQRRVEAETARELARLRQLRRDVRTGAGLMADARPRLEEIAGAYQGLAAPVASIRTAARDEATTPPELDIETVRHLGEWGHLLPLLIGRLDRPQTWVYFGLAIFLDWLLVHLFARLAAHRRAMPPGRAGFASRTPSPGTPW